MAARTSSRPRRWTGLPALALSLSLGAPPPIAFAAPSEPSAAELFREGQAEAAAADYGGAIEKFEAAMKLVAHDPEAMGVRNRMRTELVIAHLRAHAIDGESRHLSKASLLLDDFEHDLEPGQTEEREWAAQQREQIEARRDEARAAAEAQAATEAQAAAEAQAATEAAAERPDPAATDGGAPEPRPATDADPTSNGSRTLLVTGGVVTGVGVVGGVLSIAGLAMASASVETFENEPNRRDDARSQNRTGNALGIAGGVVAGIAVPTGVALLVVGAKRRRSARTAVVPYVAPGRHGSAQTGLWLHGRF